MTTPLQKFAKRIKDFDTLTRQPSKLVPYFAHFLDEESAGAVATPKVLAPMFEELRICPPANLSDVLRKSKMFVRLNAGGRRLSYQGQQHVLANIAPTEVTAAGELTKVDQPEPNFAPHFSNRNVFVVHGRNHKLRQDLFTFLRAIGLSPLEFSEVADMTGETSPYTLDVIRTGFKNAQACVALMSPDEIVEIRPEFREADDFAGPEHQPRPNVLVEAGMAVALQPARTILVRVGKIRSFSDFDGKQYVNLTGTPESKNKLVGKLRVAGCDVKTHGNDWLSVGEFKA